MNSFILKDGLVVRYNLLPSMVNTLYLRYTLNGRAQKVTKARSIGGNNGGLQEIRETYPYESDGINNRPFAEVITFGPRGEILSRYSKHLKNNSVMNDLVVIGLLYNGSTQDVLKKEAERQKQRGKFLTVIVEDINLRQ